MMTVTDHNTHSQQFIIAIYIYTLCYRFYIKKNTYICGAITQSKSADFADLFFCLLEQHLTVTADVLYSKYGTAFFIY